MTTLGASLSSGRWPLDPPPGSRRQTVSGMAPKSRDASNRRCENEWSIVGGVLSRAAIIGLVDNSPDLPSLWVDFQGMLDHETVPLNFNGTVADIERQKLELRDGLAVRLWEQDWADDGERDDLEG